MEVTEHRIDPAFLRGKLLPRKEESHKGDYGHLLIVAGCRTMPGAAVLATGAALRSGCGLVTLHAGARALQAAANRFPSAMLSEDAGECFSTVPGRLERYSAIAVGPGLGQAPATRTALEELLRQAREMAVPMVLDADALNLIAGDPSLMERIPAGSVLTPHLGELRRLLGRDNPTEEDIRDFTCRFGCNMVVKGHRSRVFGADGSRFTNTSGNAGMAKGGSGDVLTGLIGGLTARGYSPLDAACLGVWIHGHAGDVLTQECTAEAYDSLDLIGQLYRGFKAIIQ